MANRRILWAMAAIAILIAVALLAASLMPRVQRAPETARTVTITETRTATLLRVETVVRTIAHGGGPSYEVYFSPRGGCEARLLYWLSRANSSIHVMIYSFTLNSVGDALISAHRRGIDVRVVMEREEVGRGSEYERLKGAGVPVRLDTNPALMHNKVAIIDGSIVITGSFNWTASAESRNNENMIIIRSAEVAALYEGEFQRIWGQSAP
jgi:phosphatidylserine/phosphatidylglycerophosphate/cardiolipin synthase-like enzyme